MPANTTDTPLSFYFAPHCYKKMPPVHIVIITCYFYEHHQKSPVYSLCKSIYE
jgi:hypothetical protein